MRPWSLPLLIMLLPVIAGVLEPYTGSFAPGPQLEPVAAPPAAGARPIGDLTWGAPARLTADELAEAPAIIDRLIEADLAAHGQTPASATDPARFVRRLHLDLIGRIPTPAEADAALAELARSPEKGSPPTALIDRLLASEGHVAQAFSLWADLLRVESRLGGGRYPGQPYADWLKDALRRNQPAGAMVRELITSAGPAMAEGNGATGFWLRDAGMPLDHLATTMRAFLGLRIGCAQCHDHPFDTWKRRDFHALSAFTQDVQVKRDRPKQGALRPKMKEQLKDLPPEVRNAARSIADVVALGVAAPRKREAPVPADWQYDDAKPGSTLPAKVLFGPAPALAKGQDPRTALADWVTAEANPRFRLVLADRLWKQCFGAGFHEPVDNLVATSEAANPALAEFLSRLLLSLDDDQRAFTRMLVSTAAYRRLPVAEVIGDPDHPAHFAGPVARRLSAEQVWDSLLTCAIADPDQTTGERAEGVHRFYAEHHDDSAEELVALATDLGGTRQKLKALQVEAEALKQRSNAGDREARQQLRDLNRTREELRAQADPFRLLARKPDPRQKAALVRAAALPQPAPPGHFLRVFGQSDRELIDNSSREPSVPQALFLLNGVVDQQVWKEGSPLRSYVLGSGQAPGEAKKKTKAKTSNDPQIDDQRIDRLWWAVLTRRPTASERDLARAALRDQPAQGLQDLAWALLNSAEFREAP